MKLYAMTCGWLTGRRKDLIEGGEGEVRLPIPSYLIDHPKGLVLYDTGMHPRLQTDPAGHIGERAARIFGWSEFVAGDEVDAQLRAIDRDPGKIAFIVNSHLHFDHAGGNALIPNATIVGQKAEWAAGRDPELAAKIGIFKADIDHGHPIRMVDGEHDIFGDGRVVCVPTPGHTPGHQSLRVRLDSGDIVLTGDACYFCQSLRERKLPRFVFDREDMLKSLERLANLEAGGARLFFGHDAEFWATVPKAPTPVLF